MNHSPALNDLRPLVFGFLDAFRGAVSASSREWREIEHSAVMWVLATTFITFCEDNGLVSATPFRTESHPQTDPIDTIERAMDHVVQELPVLGPAFDHGTGSWWAHRPSTQLAHRLLSYARDPERAPLRAVRGNELDTSVFGELYQDLSEAARRTDALLTTPDFVVDLILDQTLEPALDEATSITEHGFRFIDPACGSGGFLLGALHCVLARILEEQPDLPLGQKIGLALSCVHGADRNPIAVMVSRFRLAVEAIYIHGELNPIQEESWPMHVVEADSLVEGEGAPGAKVNPLDTFFILDGPPETHFSPGSASEHSNVLERGSYDAVVCNPPYIVPKDKERHELYRSSYSSALGTFALTVPFTELAFALTHHGGHVGLMMANSFAKRDFGKHLVEEFLPQVTLDQVIDTSGAYIPGHGTPTLIVTGRSRRPTTGSRVTVVNSHRGEPSVPADPSQGKVWTSIRERLSHVPSGDEWTASSIQKLTDYQTHPWRLSSPASDSVFTALDSSQRLSDQSSRIGYIASTGADTLFASSPASLHRWGVEDEATIDLVTGSEVRDWQVWSDQSAFFPRRRENPSEVVDIEDFPGYRRRLLPYQRHLQGRIRQKSKTWYDWHQLTHNIGVSPWSIIFPWVATHPQFSLRRETNAPLNSAPVIELPPSVTENDVLCLLGVLNSSAACFWLKQVSNAKGNPRDGQLRSGDTWDTLYEFTATRMRDLPLPPFTEAWLPRELDTLARRLQDLRSEVSHSSSVPTPARITELGRQWAFTHRRMVMLQEELDWRVYEAYGLVSEGDLSRVAPESMPDSIDVGHRAFEIALATDMAMGSTESDWFNRHDVTPATKIPDHWDESYRQAVAKRTEAISNDPVLRVLERPDFKHRWTTSSWEAVWRPAVKGWLRDRCEQREFWYTRESDGTERPTSRTLAELIELLETDPAAVSAVEALGPGASLRELLPELLQSEHVPFLASLRFRRNGLAKHAKWKRSWDARWPVQEPHPGEESSASESQELPLPPPFTSADFLKHTYWANRGKFDLPDERFISYPSSASSALSPTNILGWAGWDARERAQALVDIIETHLAPPTARTTAFVPLLAGLAEVLPWADRVGVGIGPKHPHRDLPWLRGKFEEFLETLGLTEEFVASWTPPPPRRGRPPKQKDSS